MKTRTALVSTLAAGLGLLACNKAADTLVPSENPTGTAALAARLSAASDEAKAVLRQTEFVRATLDTGATEGTMMRLPVAEVNYTERKVSFPSLRVGVSYVLKLEGVRTGVTLWSVTHSGILGTNGSTDNSPKFEVNTGHLALKAPSYAVNGATATLTSNSSGGLAAKLYWTRDTTGDWTQDSSVALKKPDLLWAKDSIDGVASSALTPLTVDGSGTVQQQTLAAPTASLTGADNGNKSPYAGWAALSLTSNAGETGTLEYSLDGTNWEAWASGTKLYGTGTVRFREARTGYVSLVDSQGYAVNPVPLPAPTAKLSGVTASSATITLTSKTTAPYKAAILWFSLDSGKSWKSYGDTAFQVDKSLSVLSKDSLEHQKSTLCTTVVTLSAVVSPTLIRPTVLIDGKDPRVDAYGASTTPALTKGSGPLSQLPAITATCQSGSDAKVQYRLAGTASWADLSSGDLTGIDTSRTLEFRCYASPTAFSDSVSLPLILIQPPWIQASDSIFYGTLSTSISLDSVHNGMPVSRGTPDNSQIEYCLTAPSADSCQDNWFVYDNKVLSIDTSKALWARTKYTTNGTVYSYPVKRVFTKGSTSLAHSGRLDYGTGNTLDFGARSEIKSGDVKSLSIGADNAMALSIEWYSPMSPYAAYASILQPLDSLWSEFDFSNVDSISFEYSSNSPTSKFHMVLISEAYTAPEHVLGSKTFTISDSTWNRLSFPISQLQFDDYAGPKDGTDVQSVWIGAQTKIKGIVFMIQPSFTSQSNGMTISSSTAATLRVRNIRLVNNTKGSFPLMKTN